MKNTMRWRKQVAGDANTTWKFRRSQEPKENKAIQGEEDTN